MIMNLLYGSEIIILKCNLFKHKTVLIYGFRTKSDLAPMRIYLKKKKKIRLKQNVGFPSV